MPRGVEPMFALWSSVFREDQESGGLGFGWNLSPGADSVTIERAAGLCNDWLLATTSAVTLDPASSDLVLEVELAHTGAGAPTVDPANCNALVIGRHNLSTANVDRVEVVYKDAAADPWVVLSTYTVVDDLDFVHTFTPEASLRIHWGLRFVTDTPPQGQVTLGVVTLGLKFQGIDQAGTPLALDPFGFEVNVENGALEFGSPLGTQARGIRRRFSWDFPSPGLPSLGFWDAATGETLDGDGRHFFDQLQEHIRKALPFWFAWNLVTHDRDVFLCRVADTNVQSLGSDVRRSLSVELDAVERIL